MKNLHFVKSFFVIAAGFFLATSVNAQITDDELAKHPEFTSSNYLVYPEPVNIKYTKVPAGYKPFYISLTQTNTSISTRHFPRPIPQASSPSSASKRSPTQKCSPPKPPRKKAT